MLITIPLYVLLVFFVTREISRRITERMSEEVARAQAELTMRQGQKERMLKEKKVADDLAAEIFTLYDMTKEVAKHLTDEEALQIFKKKLHENFYYEECLLLEPLAAEAKELKDTEGWMVYPLRAKIALLGYLAVKGVAQKDQEKLTILANQFALALQRVRLYEEVERLAMTDSLTQTATRRAVMQRLEEEKQRADARKTPMSFLMIDVDHFKQINDTYGHLSGDQVLREVARLIRETVREIDICGRYGGEEFCVVLPDTGEEGALQVAERIRLAVARATLQAYDAKIRATVSVGVTTMRQGGMSLTEILDSADWAMYKAKQNGRNQVYASPASGKSS